MVAFETKFQDGFLNMTLPYFSVVFIKLEVAAVAE